MLVNRALDALVHAAHDRARAAGTQPHPATWGAAIAVLPLVAVLAALGRAERPLVPGAALFAVLLAYHHGFLRLKRWLVPGARRQLFLDLAVFCLPAFVAVTWALGEPVAAMADLTAVVVPPAIGLFRTGCLLGGCCHGRPSRFGVRYPGAAVRVLPLPLFEIVAALGLVVVTMTAPPGSGLPRLLVGYGAYRFVSELLRSDDVGRTLGITKTQFLAAAAVTGGLLC